MRSVLIVGMLAGLSCGDRDPPPRNYYTTGDYSLPTGGDRTAGDPNTGDPNTGDPNTGDPNTGDPNTGDPNTGDPNTGDPNTGDPNVGDPNAGDPNAGDPNAGDPDPGDPSPGDPGAGSDTIVITELMYDPGSDDSTWEWLEIHNGTNRTVNLAGAVLDDPASGPESASNIAAGIIPPGGTAVLLDNDVSNTDFIAAWGAGTLLIPVSRWPALNNAGDTISLWPSLAAYTGDDRTTPANALVTLTYDNVGAWPSNNNSASVYLTDIQSDPSDGSNWARSEAGTAGAIATTFYSAGDVASPGTLP